MTQPQNPLDALYAKALELKPTFTYQWTNPTAQVNELVDGAVAALHGASNVFGASNRPSWDVYQPYFQSLREAWPAGQEDLAKHLAADLRDLRRDYGLTDRDVLLAYSQSPDMSEQARAALAYAVAGLVLQYTRDRLEAKPATK